MLALILSLGVGSHIFQIVGWATMVPAKFSESGSLRQAVEETFGGQHPCEMCHLAARLNAADQPQEPTPTKPNPRDHENPFQIIHQLIRPVAVYPPAGKRFSRPAGNLAPTEALLTPFCPPPEGVMA